MKDIKVPYKYEFPVMVISVNQDLRKQARYSVSKVGDRIPMIIAIALKSPNYLFSPQCWGLGG
ncbi:hypothetical protein PL9631_1040085 [Planktothrix paucivesiculata PCC 9631]|uniref:Uncharacterized protein n=1 Tax=Planktothrix paucivesiculata PCC 9631 TaxID=671071 RepID=A0A7Z9DWB8_9CYAN|nr:hypothetical protein PL9631_1040085 [Planktothrix paucivesiculata PCC 9631]